MPVAIESGVTDLPMFRKTVIIALDSMTCPAVPERIISFGETLGHCKERKWHLSKIPVMKVGPFLCIIRIQAAAHDKNLLLGAYLSLSVQCHIKKGIIPVNQQLIRFRFC